MHGIEKARVARVAVGHGEAVEPPGLTAGPCGFVAGALHGKFAEDGAIGVVVNGVVSAAIGAHVILHCFQGVADGHIAPGGIAAILRREQQQLEIHHVVNDDGDVAVVIGPGFDDARAGPIKSGHGLRGGLDHVHVGGIAGDAVGVSVAAEHFEADIVVSCVGVLAQ
jgi:hypothetical protein